jgi:hypothetical protein
VTFDTRMVTQLGEMLHQIVVDLGSGVGLANDEMSVAQIIPRDLIPMRQFMVTRQSHENAFIPQMRPIATVGDRRAG